MAVPSANRREIIPDGSTAASMRQMFASEPPISPWGCTIIERKSSTVPNEKEFFNEYSTCSYRLKEITTQAAGAALQ